jgi:hypothetical protein
MIYQLCVRLLPDQSEQSVLLQKQILKIYFALTQVSMGKGMNRLFITPETVFHFPDLFVIFLPILNFLELLDSAVLCSSYYCWFIE